MTSSLRERRRQMLYESILEASQQMIAEKGYAAMSMDDLAARVGVSKPTLYSQFARKEDLVVAMAMRGIGQLLEIVADSAAPGRSPLSRLGDLMRAGVRLHLNHSNVAMQLWMPEIVAMLKTHAEPLDSICQIDDAVVGLVRQAIAAGEIDPQTDPASIMRIFYALMVSPNVGRLSAATPADLHALADTVTAFFLRGLRRADAEG
jgi:AcrR family transcriptional regulator